MRELQLENVTVRVPGLLAVCTKDGWERTDTRGLLEAEASLRGWPSPISGRVRREGGTNESRSCRKQLTKCWHRDKADSPSKL